MLRETIGYNNNSKSTKDFNKVLTFNHKSTRPLQNKILKLI